MHVHTHLCECFCVCVHIRVCVCENLCPSVRLFASARVCLCVYAHTMCVCMIQCISLRVCDKIFHYIYHCSFLPNDLYLNSTSSIIQLVT